MTKAELIKLLDTLPDDAVICTGPEGDDIMGEYSYNSHILVHEAMALKSENGVYWTTYSNYAPDKSKQVYVWVLG